MAPKWIGPVSWSLCRQPIGGSTVPTGSAPCSANDWHAVGPSMGRHGAALASALGSALSSTVGSALRSALGSDLALRSGLLPVFRPGLRPTLRPGLRHESNLAHRAPILSPSSGPPNIKRANNDAKPPHPMSDAIRSGTLTQMSRPGKRCDYYQ